MNNEVSRLLTAAAIAAALLQDREYIEMVNKARGLFVDGAFRDTIVTSVG